MREVRPLRAYAEVALGRQRSPVHDQGPHMVPYLRAANVKDGALDLEDVKEMNFAPDEQAVFGLHPGDVLVTEGSGSLRAVGASAVWHGEIEGIVCFQNTVLRLRPRPSTDPRFLAWWCRFAFADGLFASIATGANIFHVSADRVRSLPLSYVPLTRQRAIADYLDAETARIDALIAKKRRMIDLFEERNQARLDNLVASSSNDSRRVMLGQVLERLIDYRGATPEKSSDGVPLLTASNVVDGRIDMDGSRQFIDEGLYREWMRRGLPQMGDLVLTTEAPLGEIAVLDDVHVALAQRLILLRPRRDLILSEYLYMYLRSGQGRAEVLSRASGSTVMGVRTDRLRAVPVIVPSISVQRDIVEAVRETDGMTRIAGRLIREQAGLFAEHRQALITAAVTGELAIPGVAA